MGEKGGKLGTTPRALHRYLLREPPNMTQLSGESLRERCYLIVSKNYLLCYLLFTKEEPDAWQQVSDRQDLHHVIRASITTMCVTGVTPLPWIWHLTPLSHEKTTDRRKWRNSSTRRRVDSYLFHSVQLSTQSESKVWMSDLTLCNGSMETGNTLRHQEWYWHSRQDSEKHIGHKQKETSVIS